MERNPNDNLDSQGFEGGAGSGSTGSGSFGASGSDAGSGGYGGSSGLGSSGSQGYGAGISSGSGGSFGTTSGSGGFGNTGSGSLGDKASDLKESAQDKASQFKEKAADLKATLADKLQAGAEKLRSQQGGYAAATGTASANLPAGQMGQVNDKLAAGMQSTADFIRNADIANLQEGVERQVKENPGRTLLIAAGLGYLIGKAFRK